VVVTDGRGAHPVASAKTLASSDWGTLPTSTTDLIREPKERTMKRIVLVGAGHAHLYVAWHAGRLVRQGIEVTLVDPDRFWYSGLATGMLGGMYEAEVDQVDPGPLLERRGGRFIRDRVVSLDRKRRVARLKSGAELDYDAVSFNVGSEVALAGVPGAESHALPVKPTSNMWRIRRRLEERFAGGTGPVRVVVAGGGASGCEVAANVAALGRRRRGPAVVMLISRSDRLLPRFPAAASRRALAELQRLGVMISAGCAVDEATPGRVVCSDGRHPEFDLLVMATGLHTPAIVAGLGVALGEKGGVLVGSTLQSVDDPAIFAAGDCADLQGRPLDRLGVFAVRQSPILLGNLAAVLTGARLAEFRPQRRCLSILNLGEEQGLAVWGRLAWQGRLALAWKDRIDRRFLAGYRELLIHA
jgi:NADH dehydrogenase FAD-containing subunit